MTGDPRHDQLSRLMRHSSLGGPAMDHLCARTSGSSVDGILLKASLQTPDGGGGGEQRRTTVRWPYLPSPGSRGITFFAVLLLAAFIVLPRLHVLTGDAALVLVDVAPAVAALMGCLLCFRAAHQAVRPGTREGRAVSRGWFLLGLSALSWASGELIWTWYGLFRGQAVPLPSLADVGYQLALPFMTLGLLAFVGVDRIAATRIRLLVDGCLVGLSLAGLVWLTSVGDVLAGSSEGFLGQYLLVSYPLVDAVNLAVVGGALACSRPLRPVPLGSLFAALGCLGVSDLGFLYQTQQGIYDNGNLIDLGWIVGFFILGLAAGHRSRLTPRARAGVVPPFLRTTLPHGAAAVLLLAVAATALRGRHIDSVLAVDTITVVLLSFIRLAVVGVQSSLLCQQLMNRTAALADEMSDLHRSVDSELADLVGDLPRMRAESVLDSFVIRTQIMEQQAAGLLRDADRLQQRLGGAARR